MCHVDNEKRTETIIRRNKAGKSRKDQNAQKKVKVKSLRDNGSEQHQIGGIERKHRKEHLRRTKKTSPIHDHQQKSHQRDKYQGIPL